MATLIPHFRSPFSAGESARLYPYRDAVLTTPGIIGVWDHLGSDLAGADVATANGGVLTGQPSILPNGEGFSADLNGSTAYFSILDSPTFDVGDKCSVEIWIELDALGSLQYVIDLGLNSGTLRISATNKVEWIKQGISVIVASTTTLEAGVKYHLVATKNGATNKLYAKAVDVTGAVTNATLENNATNKTIGRRSTASAEFVNGRIEYPALYNVDLSAATVAAHYAAGSAPSVRSEGFATVEQNSAEEIEGCVEAVLRTLVGSRIEAPDFGTPDETFHQLGPEPTAEVYLNAIAEWEPRARVLGTSRIEELTERITIEMENE